MAVAVVADEDELAEAVASVASVADAFDEAACCAVAAVAAAEAADGDDDGGDGDAVAERPYVAVAVVAVDQVHQRTLAAVVAAVAS